MVGGYNTLEVCITYPGVNRLARVQRDVGSIALNKHAKANLEFCLHAVVTVEGHN